MDWNRRMETRASSPPFLGLTAVALFLALHLAAAFLLPGRVWGADHLRYLAPWAWPVWVAAAAVVLLPRGRKAVAASARMANGFLRRWGVGRPALLFAVSWLFLLLFRTRNLFLGDGLLITSVVQNPAESGMGAAGFVSLTIHRLLLNVLRLLNPSAGGAAPFVVTSTLAGAGVVLLARLVSKEIVSDPKGRALLFVSVICSGGMLLFFGYVEYYPLMQAAVLLYLSLSVRYLHGRGGPLAPTIALATAVLLHVSSIVLAPSWILLLAGRCFTRKKAIALAVPLLLVGTAGAWGLLRYTERFYRGLHAFLPLLRKGDHSYSFLSGAHASFVGNEVLLLFGGALLLPLLRLPWGRGGERRGRGREGSAGRPPAPAETGGGRTTGFAGEGSDAAETEGTGEREEAEERDRAVGRFLGVSALLSLSSLLSLDPYLGCRDWDLMAMPLFPSLLWLGHRFLGRETLLSESAAVLLAGAMFLHSCPWIAVQLDRDRAVAMTVASAIRDPHYANPAARAPKAFGVLLSKAGYPAEAALFFEKAASVREDAQNLFNLGTSRAREGKHAEAVELLTRAIALEPRYAQAYLNLALSYTSLGDLESAEGILRELLAFAPGYGKAHRALGFVLAEKGAYDDALTAFRRAVVVDPSDGDSWLRIGLLLASAGKNAEAEDALRHALAIDPANERAARLLSDLGAER